MCVLLGLLVRLNALDDYRAEDRDRHGDQNGEYVAISEADRQADMLQSFEDRYQRDRERGEKYVHRHIPLGLLKGVFLAQDESLHAEVDQVGNKAGRHRRYDPAHDDGADLAPLHRIHADTDRGKAHDSADNRMRRRDRPAILGSDQQPGSRREQCGQHAVDQQLGRSRQQVRIDDTLAHRIGDRAAGQHGAEKLEYRRNKNCLLDRQRLGADRRRHGIGDIIGANTPGHEDAEQRS